MTNEETIRKGPVTPLPWHEGMGAGEPTERDIAYMVAAVNLAQMLLARAEAAEAERDSWPKQSLPIVDQSAALDMERCKTCRWWDGPKTEPWAGHVAECDHPRFSAGRYTYPDGCCDSGGYGGVYTGPEFGCIHHEPRTCDATRPQERGGHP